MREIKVDPSEWSASPGVWVMKDMKVEVYQLLVTNSSTPPPSTVHYPLGEVTWALLGTLQLVRRWHFAPCCSAAMLSWVDVCTWDLQRELVGNEFLGKMWICVNFVS